MRHQVRQQRLRSPIPRPSLMPFLFACLVLIVSGCDRRSTSSSEQRALSRTVNELLLPWHELFVKQTKLLQDSAERFCQNPRNSGEFSATRDAWRQAALAWQSVKIINFGPLAEHNKSLSLQPWLENHHIVLRQVETLLAEDTPLTGSSLAQMTTLAPSLSVIEYMLFDPTRGRIETYHDPRACQLLRTISNNTRESAQALADGWQPRGDNYVATLLSPGPSNMAFPEIRDSLTVILDAVISTLESLKEQRIGEPFDDPSNTGHSSEFELEFWRSRFSLAATRQELRSSRQLLSRALTPVLKDKGHSALASKIERTLQGAEDHLDRLAEPLFGTGTRHASAEPQLLRQRLEQALAMLRTDVPPVLRMQ